MKASGKNGWVIYVMGVLICSCLSFFFLVLSGIIGERLPIRCYLTFGMLASGAFTALFGVGYFYNIHSFGFYVITQVRSGPWLTTCWVSTMSWMGCSCHLCQERRLRSMGEAAELCPV